MRKGSELLLLVQCFLGSGSSLSNLRFMIEDDDGTLEWRETVFCFTIGAWAGTSSSDESREDENIGLSGPCETDKVLEGAESSGKSNDKSGARIFDRPMSCVFACGSLDLA